MNFITRKGAADKIKKRLFGNIGPGSLQRFGRLYDMTRRRNYELEAELNRLFGGDWCIAEWCPYNGRFCTMADFVEPPHPPLRGVTPDGKQTDIPWREFDGRLTDTYRPTDRT